VDEVRTVAYAWAVEQVKKNIAFSKSVADAA